MIHRPIGDDDLPTFIKMYADMNKVLINSSYKEAFKQLMYDMSERTDFIANGIFDNNNTLIGFISGFGINKSTFYISSIYTIEEYRMKGHIVTLINDTAGIIKELGYRHLETNLLNSDITGFAGKYGFNPMYTRYRSEDLKWAK